MDFSGTVEIAAPRQAVWDLLLDFEGLATCGPGVESVEVVDSTHARVNARLGMGFIVARFTLELELGTVEPPNHAEIHGRGEAPGSQVEGRAEMRLSGPPEGPTTMSWTAEVQLFGSVAGIGMRLIESAAGRLIDQAFDCFRERLSGGVAPANPATT